MTSLSQDKSMNMTSLTNERSGTCNCNFYGKNSNADMTRYIAGPHFGHVLYTSIKLI